MFFARIPLRLILMAAFFGGLSATFACAPVADRIDRASDWQGVPADAPPGVASEAAMETAPQPASTPLPPQKALRVGIADAVRLCLENNRSLKVQRLDPAIRRTFEDQERATFDPTVGAELSIDRTDAERLARSGSDTESYTTSELDGVLFLEQYFPTGTKIALEAGTEMDDSSLYDNRFFSTRLGLTITQSVLQGYGTGANFADLRRARLDTRMSAYELRGFTASLVAGAEHAFWDYSLARRRIEIVEESLKVARRQLEETMELISVGRMARVEMAAVQAEVASQEQALIEANAAMEINRLRLLRLMGPPSPGGWGREVEAVQPPAMPDADLRGVEAHVAGALGARPVLNQARLDILRGDLQVVKTRNGLLPLLDLFVTLGKTGYSNAFGESVENLGESRYDARAGVRFLYPLFNRDADAEHRRAKLSGEQARAALDNLSQLVEVDVRTAYVEVDRTRRQIAASSATRRFDEEKLRTENEKFRVGRSTGFLVSQAQRDLLASRIAEVKALTDHLKALIDLYLQDGSLLERRGIDAPGKEPARLSES